ncbi:MAG: hypothetical protein S4CHLAM7_14830 [Chlamydiae bacterium]|nr:hypothetical protein [Chlamydiota bacterium]
MGMGALFMVFCTLLSQLIVNSYQEGKKRPKIYDCFVYRGDFSSLNNRLEQESKYVDKFVIVQSATSNELSKVEKETLFKRFPEKITCITASILEDTDLKSHYLKGLEGCNKGDIILLSSVNQIVDAKMLYKSFNQIGTYPRIEINLKANTIGELSTESEVKALSYQFYKNDISDLYDIKKNLKQTKLKKRKLFFQISKPNL